MTSASRVALAFATTWLLACGDDEPSFTRRASLPDPPAEPAAGSGSSLADRFIARAREMLPAATIERRDDRHVVVDGVTVDLSNLSAECERSEDVCDTAIDRWIRARSAAPEPSRELVRAVLLHDEQLVEVPRSLRRPFVGMLWEIFVLDTPDAIVFMTEADLGALGSPTLDELHALAIENMREAFGATLPHETMDERSHIQIVSTSDSYEAARVLLTEPWAAVAAEVEGDLLVTAPARDIVLFCGTGSDTDVRLLRYLAQAMTANEHHPIGPTILRWTGEGFELFDENLVPAR